MNLESSQSNIAKNDTLMWAIDAGSPKRLHSILIHDILDFKAWLGLTMLFMILRFLHQT